MSQLVLVVGLFDFLGVNVKSGYVYFKSLYFY
jgi:hypothetical protein